MTSVFSWKNSISLCPASFCTPRPNLPVTSGVSGLPTFAFQSPIMKRTSFWGVSSRRSCRSSQNCSTSAASVLLVRAQIWITVILNGLPWKQTNHSVVFETVSKYCISDSFVDYDGYSISSKGFLPTVVDIMVILVKFTHSSPSQFADFQNVNVHSCHFLFDHFQFALIHGPNIPGSYAILLLTASTLASITSPVHNWVLFFLWLHPFFMELFLD